MSGKPAASGMIEVLILIMVAVAGTGILAGWFAAFEQRAPLECIAWIDTDMISAGRHWGTATIYNTGQHAIGQYHVVSGKVIVSGDVPISPGQKTAMEFVVADGDLYMLEVMVAGGPAAGTSLCEVIGS